MAPSPARRLLSTISLFAILLACLPASAGAQSPDIPDSPPLYLPYISHSGASDSAPLTPTPEPETNVPSVRTIPSGDEGEWPQQLAASTGDIAPSIHGPQRNDPAEGIPVHAYSPFDERNNREHPCPPGGCDIAAHAVLVKLTSEAAAAQRSDVQSAAADEAFVAAGVLALTPVFPNAEPPVVGASVVDTDGIVRAMPDLSAWFEATLPESSSAADASAESVTAENIITESNAIAAAVETLKTSDNVLWAEPIYVRKPVGDFAEAPSQRPATKGDGSVSAAETFNDPLYAQQWHLAAANVPAAWDYLSSQGLPPGGNRDIVVAVIDTGIDLTHPDLAANLWVNAPEFNGAPGVDDDGNGYVDDKYGANTVTNSGNPADDHGHGTHVAGIIAAQGNNGAGGVGVAYNVQVMAIKAAQYSGILTSDDIAQAIYYAKEMGADVINMSFGGYSRSQIEEDALAVAFGQAVLVAAAGNDSRVNQPCPGGRDMYPGAYNWVLGVMASTSGGVKAGFSNFDCTPRDTHEYELMAPGVDIWSTLPQGKYAEWDGTSMAAPVVSGIAALARTKWADKVVYSSRFIMGQIAANTSASFGGVANAFNAVTVAPQPLLTYLEHWLFDTTAQSPTNDPDGIVDAGETIDLAITIRNHWGSANPVSVLLEPWAEGAFQPDPYITMITDTVDYGAVGSFNKDDNGLIYDGTGTFTGVLHPFRFVAAPDTPNDHVIPFRLTVTAGNGYDSGQPMQQFVSRFYLVVQNGVELPRIIDEDMVLSNDHLWIVPDATLIEAGVTVTVTEGAQIQFWTADPNSPYSLAGRSRLRVEGSIAFSGTTEAPVELFPSSVMENMAVEVSSPQDLGLLTGHHVRIANPQIGVVEFSGWPLGSNGHISHAYFVQLEEGFYKRDENGVLTWVRPAIRVSSLTDSIVSDVGKWVNAPYLVFQEHSRNLFSSSYLDFGVRPQGDSSPPNTSGGHSNVFLKNRMRVSDGSLWASLAQNVGFAMYPDTFLKPVLPTEWNGSTYFLIPSHMTLPSVAQAFAASIGGNVVTIDNASENEFLRQNFATLDASQIPGSFGNRTAASLFSSYVALIGLCRMSPNEPYGWLSGQPAQFQNWDPGLISTKETRCAELHSNGLWRTGTNMTNFTNVGGGVLGWIIEVPGHLEASALEAARSAFVDSRAYSQFADNAILNVWREPVTSRWLGVRVDRNRAPFYGLSDLRDWRLTFANNYWGMASQLQIDASIRDYVDDFDFARYIVQPILTTAPESAYPFVVDVAVNGTSGAQTPRVGAEPVTFVVTFNRDMDQTVQPAVSFGPDLPFTDYTVHGITGGWTDARTWQGTFNVNPITGDGIQLLRVAGAVAADDAWLVTGDDSERFAFEVITSGTEAMNLQATGGEGYVDLMWTQDDFDLLAGFNLYRSTSQNGTYERINPSIIPPDLLEYRDTAVTPGIPYYYKFTVVKSDMSESDYSNVATGTPLDTIAPSISHTPVTSAAPGLGLTIFADVTDNVAVQAVTLFHRPASGGAWASRTMPRTTGNRFSATLEGSLITSPGVQYYIEASDGVSTARSGRAENPWSVSVVDKPVVTSVSPVSGPAGGNTAVTVRGTNFKPGASVGFGGAICASIVVVSSTEITCVTPAHLPAPVDVRVTNPDAQFGQLLAGYTYTSQTASISLPAVSGGQNDIVTLPVEAANVQGMLSASFNILFDPAVVSIHEVRNGALTSGWSVDSFSPSSGRLRITLASASAVSGSGALAEVDIEMIGTSGESSALTLENVLLNDGNIPVETTPGSASVELVYSVAGTIRFWQGAYPVPAVQMLLHGDRDYSAQSGSTGAYTVEGARPDAYSLTPSLSGEVRSSITAFDASLVLAHDVGRTPLSGNAFVAADVNRNGNVTAFDASSILQYSVGLTTLPFPNAGRVWDFSPASRTYGALNSNLAGEDFTAILLGDVSGNWGTSTVLAAGADAGVRVTLVHAVPESDGTQVVEVWVDPGDAGRIYSLEIDLRYDAAPFDALLPAAAEGWAFEANRTQDGRLRVATASAQPITQKSRLLQLRFAPHGSAINPNITVTSLALDEAYYPVADGMTRTMLPMLSK